MIFHNGHWRWNIVTGWFLLAMVLGVVSCDSREQPPEQDVKPANSVYKPADPVVLLINSDTFKFSTFATEFIDLAISYNNIESITDDIYGILVNECMDTLINNYFLDKEAQRRKLKIDDKEVVTELMKFARQFEGQRFEQYLFNRNLNYKQFKEVFRKDLLRLETIKSIKNDVPPVSKKLVKVYYNKHKSEFVIQPVIKFTQFYCNNINDARWVLEKYRRDEMFDFLEEEHLKKFESGHWGMGRWDYTTIDSVPKKFQQLLKKLEPGEVSKIIAYENIEEKDDGATIKKKNYYFFIMEDKIRKRKLRFKEAKPLIEKKIMRNLQQEKFSAWLEQEKSNAVIKKFPENINRQELFSRLESIYSKNITRLDEDTDENNENSK